MPTGLMASLDMAGVVTALNAIFAASFKDRLRKLLADGDGVRCVVTDVVWYSVQAAARELGVPALRLMTSSAASFRTFVAYPILLDKGYLPVQESCKEDTVHELPPFGAPRSGLFVSLGTVAAIDAREFAELARGLAGSSRPFLWVVRPNLVCDTSGELLHPLVDVVEEEETRGGRRRVVPWVPQEEVLAHPTISAFLTHNDWDSTVEAVSEGVPMICRPYFRDQRAMCAACSRWEWMCETSWNEWT
ncbi:hypothetical protein QOZ80_6BG0478260 [Eleusine coracana subsp. coracana]|nr:hypothetical protein QOZ80_6BG0478260 [Eleusine coracana subsp. coracana]